MLVISWHWASLLFVYPLAVDVVTILQQGVFCWVMDLIPSSQSKPRLDAALNRE